jgi:sulfur-oxidizing protein SoxA
LIARVAKVCLPAAIALSAIVFSAFALPQLAAAGPEDDRLAFVAHYAAKFPDVPFEEFANGIYALDENARAQWLSIEDFPPYEFSIDRGAELWSAPFAQGGSLADCFGAEPGDVRPRFPRYERGPGVVTLQLAINRCRGEHGAAAWDYDSADMIDLTAFLAWEARGTKVDVRIPANEPGALAAYEAGKRFYYSKRGQLNFACADCHVTSVGQYVRADRLGPSLGHPTHFPVYRSKLGGMISLHQRFYGCVRDVRAKPFALQSPEFRNLEFFLSYMSNGLEINGPGARK